MNGELMALLCQNYWYIKNAWNNTNIVRLTKCVLRNIKAKLGTMSNRSTHGYAGIYTEEQKEDSKFLARACASFIAHLGRMEIMTPRFLL